MGLLGTAEIMNLLKFRLFKPYITITWLNPDSTITNLEKPVKIVQQLLKGCNIWRLVYMIQGFLFFY